ncbi:MAG: hypothetical protein ACRDNX_04935, partial [Gaiellaceae bacterium]
GPAHAGGPTMLVGAAEDFVKQPDIVSSKAKLDLGRLAGFDSVRVTVNWMPGQTAPPAAEAKQLATLAAAARLSGVRVLVAVFHPGSRTTPLTDEARAEFSSFAAAIARANPSFRTFIIGNEPNLNRFWLPQFNPDGSNAAAPAYLQLLARTYDELKAVSPAITVVGGVVSPRGIDRPGSGRDTHSPTKFIRDLGLAYRASGRTVPVMDQFAIHPYPDSNQQTPADWAHPNSTTIGLADYGKLVALLAEAFDGTAQPGSTLPILYAEFGVQSAVPAEKASHYTGAELATTPPVDEATQGTRYREAIQLAFCQPNVRGLFFFHIADEPALPAWQSGVFYADGSPKTSLPAVAAAAAASRRGIVARCEGLALTPTARRLRPPTGSIPSRQQVRFRLDCDIDCDYTARLERMPAGTAVLTRRGRAIGRTLTTLAFPRRVLRPGTYRISVELVAPVNPGPPGTRTSVSFRVRR